MQKNARVIIIMLHETHPHECENDLGLNKTPVHSAHDLTTTLTCNNAYPIICGRLLFDPIRSGSSLCPATRVE